MGVGDEVALIASENVIDRVARVVARELEQHVASGGDQNAKVPCATALLLLNEHPRRIDA